jgi:hypothetical protein
MPPFTIHSLGIMNDGAWWFNVRWRHYRPISDGFPHGGRRIQFEPLRARFLDFAGGYLEVRRNLTHGTVTTPKSGESRWVDISLELMKTLEALLSTDS